MTSDVIPRSRWGRIVLITALLMGTAFRLARLLENRPLWTDEAKLALNIGRRGFVGLTRPLDYNQVAPILYLWLLKAGTYLLGMHEWVLRLPSLAVGILMILVVWLLGRRVLSEVGALVAVILTATAPLLVAYAAEAKPYELDAFVTAVLLLLAMRVHERDDVSRRAILGLAGVTGITFSIPALFVLGGISGAFLFAALRRRNWSAMTATFVWGVIWLSAFLLQRSLTYSNAATADVMQSFWRDVMIRIGQPGWIGRFFVSIYAGILVAMDPGRTVVRIFAPIAAAVGALYIWRRSGSTAALILMLSFALALLASGLAMWPVDGRLALFLAPIAFLLLAAFADLLWHTSAYPTAVRGAVVICTIFGAVFNIMRPSPFPPLEASRDLIAGLSGERANAPVYVFPAGIPSWLFYTTNWQHPDTARLDWYARIEPHRNAPSRRHAVMEFEPTFNWKGPQGLELVGRSTGMQFVMERGWLTPGPDPNWGNAEAKRLSATTSPVTWVYGSHLPDSQVDSLRLGLQRNGGEILSEKRGNFAILWQVRFR